MSLVVASIIGVGVFKLFQRQSDTFEEICPAPFYGNDELANAFAEAFANKK